VQILLAGVVKILFVFYIYRKDVLGNPEYLDPKLQGKLFNR
jgi:hypothetical protein